MGNDIDRRTTQPLTATPRTGVQGNSATGQRIKGAIKEEVGDMIDDEEMEDKGARENDRGQRSAEEERRRPQLVHPRHGSRGLSYDAIDPS